MLNELQQARRGLAAAGISLVVRHPDVGQPQKTLTLKVRLDRDGGVADVEMMTPEIAKASWAIGDGNHNKFPRVAIRTSIGDGDSRRPLLQVPTADERIAIARDGKRSLEDRLKAVLELTDRAAVDAEAIQGWPGTKYAARVSDRLNQLRSLERDELTACVPAMFGRFLEAARDAPRLFDGIAATLRDAVRNRGTDDLVQAAVGLLLEGEFPLYFDIAEDDFPRDASDPQNVGPISEVLLADDSQAETGRCGLSGSEGQLVEGKFPQPNLPRLGQTYLFARNEAIPCTARYGRHGPASMPVTAATAVALQGAAQTLTAPGRQGKTWAAAPSERQENDLLLAYIAAAPEAEVADFLTTDPDAVSDDPQAASRFNEKARRLAEAVRGRITNQQDESLLRVMVLRRVDPGNRKVIYSGEQSVARLLQAAEEWTAGFRLVPPVRLPVPVGRGKPPAQRMPGPIPPAALVPLSRSQFIRGGRERQDMIGGSYADALMVFWGSEPLARRAAGRWLRLLLPRRRELLAGIGQARIIGMEALKDFKNGAKESLDTISTFHVLLAKLGRSGECYMNDTAYQFGQILAAADVLHRGYCQDRRGGAIPPNLIGNSVLPMAQTNPRRAAAALGRRWHVYSIWAKTTDVPGKPPESADPKSRQKIYDIRNAIFVLRNAAPLARSLEGRLPSTANDEFRAELLLGYMAGLPIPKVADPTSDNDLVPADEPQMQE